DSSVLQEATTLAGLIDVNRDKLDNCDSILLYLLDDVARLRKSLYVDVGVTLLRRAGNEMFARLYLEKHRDIPEKLLIKLLILLESGLLQTIPKSWYSIKSIKVE